MDVEYVIICRLFLESANTGCNMKGNWKCICFHHPPSIFENKPILTWLLYDVFPWQFKGIVKMYQKIANVICVT